MTILIVDPDPTVLTTVSQMLTAEGHWPLVAKSGREALKVCEESPRKIDLLITDINMPGMTGVELARCLAETHPNMSALFMTSESLETPQMRVLIRDGHFQANEVLRKPFSSKALTKALKRVPRAS